MNLKHALYAQGVLGRVGAVGESPSSCAPVIDGLTLTPTKGDSCLAKPILGL